MTEQVKEKEKQLHGVFCGKCEKLIAMSDREEMSIRYRDLYLYFYGGLAIIICQRCGTPNCIIDEGYEKANPDFVNKIKSMHNMKLARFRAWISPEKMGEILNQHEKET